MKELNIKDGDGKLYTLIYYSKALKRNIRLVIWETQKGKNIVPSHALAMSIALNKDSFPRWEVDLPTALAYLRRESFHSLPDDLPTGYIILYYQNIPLGFVKNIGSRANNLYWHRSLIFRPYYDCFLVSTNSGARTKLGVTIW